MALEFKKLVLLGVFSSLVACGGDTIVENSSDDDTSDTSDTTIDETASEVVTTRADVNGFSIVTEQFNARTYDIAGTVVNISAYVKDHSNNPVADGTVVTFVADDHGLVQDQCETTDGSCSVTWTSASDRSEPGDPNATNPNSDYIITIMARTVGEDSFIDKNANSLYDVGETWFTQSEPYLDADDNGSYDSGVDAFDEFFDYNSNGTFDDASAFTLFRGVSCSSGAIAQGHCAGTLEVWDTVTMIKSSGQVGSIALYQSDCTTAVTTIDVSAGPVTYCLEISDPNGNVPPEDTKIATDTDNGEIVVASETVPNVYVLPGTGFRSDLRIKADDTTSTGGTLTIEVEWLNGLKSYAFFVVND